MSVINDVLTGIPREVVVYVAMGLAGVTLLLVAALVVSIALAIRPNNAGSMDGRTWE